MSLQRRFQFSSMADSCKTGATRFNDPIRARCVVLDDGSIRLAIVVVDTCMMPRELIDRAKELAREKTGIPTDRMLISATHTHSAPSAMGPWAVPPMRITSRSSRSGSPSRSNVRSGTS